MTTLKTLTLAAALVVATGLAFTTPATAEDPPRLTTKSGIESGRINANGVNYYYEIHGAGEPLLLLHGGLGSLDMFGAVRPAFEESRKVITVDLHGHGRTTLGDRKISMVDMGNDMAVLLDGLKLAQVDVLGYSMGGEVALRLAIQHPAKVRRLVLVSSAFAQNGFYPEMLPQQAAVGAAMADAMKETPMYKTYAAVAPKPEDFPKLLDRMGELMRTPYDWSEDVKKLQATTMLVYGDSDMYRPEHIIKFYQLLGGGLKDAGWNRENMSKNRLAILPGLTHYDIFMSPDVAHAALPFLNGQMEQKNWSEQVPDKK